MFFKIDNEYYIKMRRYYKKVDIQGTNIVPSKEENSIITDMSITAIPISYEEILKETSNNISINNEIQETTLRHRKRK